MNAIAQYHAKTCLRFIPRTSEADYIYFDNAQTGCWSSVGRVGRKQTINLQAACLSRIGTVIHEMMHAVGFLHEQNREDRDGFVSIQWQNVPENVKNNFDKASPGSTIAYNVPYDYGSVLHYSATAFSNSGSKTIVPLVSYFHHNLFTNYFYFNFKLTSIVITMHYKHFKENIN